MRTPASVHVKIKVRETWLKNVNNSLSCFWLESCSERGQPHHTTACISHSCQRQLFYPMREKVVGNAVCQDEPGLLWPKSMWLLHQKMIQREVSVNWTWISNSGRSLCLLFWCSCVILDDLKDIFFYCSYILTVVSYFNWEAKFGLLQKPVSVIQNPNCKEGRQNLHLKFI